MWWTVDWILIWGHGPEPFTENGSRYSTYTFLSSSGAWGPNPSSSLDVNSNPLNPTRPFLVYRPNILGQIEQVAFLGHLDLVIPAIGPPMFSHFILRSVSWSDFTLSDRLHSFYLFLLCWSTSD